MWDSSPTGDMVPTRIWRHPCPKYDQSPHVFDFPWSSSSAEILHYKQNLFGALLSLSSSYFYLRFDFRVLQVSHKRTQIKHVNQ